MRRSLVVTGKECALLITAYGARAFHGMFFTYFNMEEMLMRKEYKPAAREKAIEEFVKIFTKGTEK
jgi:hypothetical protein